MIVSIYSTFNNDIFIDLKLDIYMCTKYIPNNINWTNLNK